MALRFLGIARRIPDRIEADPQLLNECHAALVEASRGSGPTLQAMIDIGRVGQKIIPDSTRQGRKTAFTSTVMTTRQVRSARAGRLQGTGKSFQLCLTKAIPTRQPRHTSGC
jgi:hypothetical protein